MVEWIEENVRHLLSRAGFGAKPNEIRRFLRLGQALSVEKLVGQRPSRALGPGKNDKDATSLARLRRWWARRMAKQGNRRLEEKMCLFWHDHFATQYSVVKNVKAIALQNRTFREHGLGSFHTLVHEVTKDAAMLVFLDGRLNRKNHVNENYGRELMELFVLGVADSNGQENYTQTDVQELSRALTGFRLDRKKQIGRFDPGRFDGGTKTLFAGKPFEATGNLGVEDAAGPLPPERNVIDILFSHRDSDGALTMPRFLGRKLWEFFAYPNPSEQRIDEVTADFISGGFVIRDLLRSIFLHDDFYGDAAKSSTVKNPCEFLFCALRALEARTSFDQVPDALAQLGMALFEPPSVNGWRQGLAWLSSGLFLSRWAVGQAIAAGRDRRVVKLVLRKLFDEDAPDVEAVVDGLLARLGIAAAPAGPTPAGTRQALIAYMNDWPTAPDLRDPTCQETKVRGLVALLLELPEFHLH